MKIWYQYLAALFLAVSVMSVGSGAQAQRGDIYLKCDTAMLRGIDFGSTYHINPRKKLWRTLRRDGTWGSNNCEWNSTDGGWDCSFTDDFFTGAWAGDGQIYRRINRYTGAFEITNASIKRLSHVGTCRVIDNPKANRKF